ncbi:hypothetical protein V493_03067, partial [Pseudogymnoascus sp. VKM F-4281 (FW-2241)]
PHSGSATATAAAAAGAGAGRTAEAGGGAGSLSYCDTQRRRLQTNGLDELVDDARERVRGDLGATDLRRVGLHAQLPLSARGGDGGNPQVRRAVVGAPVRGADRDVVVCVVDGAGFLLGDVGLDGSYRGVDEVHGHGHEEGVEDQLGVVGEEVREVGPRFDAREERREPVLTAWLRWVGAAVVRAVAPRV